MKQKTIQALYAYWNELRAGRLAPRRLDIEPSRISAVLPETFMLERTSQSTFHYRLAGTRLCEIFRTELRGTDFLSGWTAEDRAMVVADLKSTCDQGAVTLLRLEAVSDTAHRLELEVIMLPLSHPDNVLDRVIGAMSPLASPHWLGFERLASKRLLHHELIWPDGRPRALLDRAGQQPPFQPAPPSVRTVRNARRLFRVFEGGRAKT
jgi:hypothetical protein